MGYTSSRRKYGRKIFPRLRIGYVLPLYKISTVTNQIILIHQTVIMLKQRQTFPIPPYKMEVNKIKALIYQKRATVNR